MLRRIVADPSFVLVDLSLVSLSAALWILLPQLGFWVLLIAGSPWMLRLFVGTMPFRRTSLDWLIALFLITAWAGYWAAYDKGTAWSKVWLIVLAVLLYYALAAQPQGNIGAICSLLFCIGLGISIYFFLTHDFIALPRKVEFVNRIGRSLMEIRPQLSWTPIHPNYVAGLVSITTPFILYPARNLWEKRSRFSLFLGCFVGLGLTIASLAILIATSRGVIMAIASALGLGMIWWVTNLISNRFQFRRETVFSLLIIAYLCAVVLFLYAGPANSGSVFSDHYHFGIGSRAELFARSLSLASDFPFTGGGLASFPGLYSYYILGIPFYNVINSHNLFLDVFVEQGWFGGVSFFFIYALSIWFTAKGIAKAASLELRIFHWLILIGLTIALVHGMVDDYLYNGQGTLLCLALVGLSAMMQPELVLIPHPVNYRIPGLAVLVGLSLFVLNWNEIRSVWYANLGAVQMARVVLTGFPTNQWTDWSVLPALEPANASLHAALQADPMNRTANHRLGLGALLQRDFPTAVQYLETAYHEAPHHRGIIKSLGYGYVWSGNVERATSFLDQIPEARSELEVYVWWWGTEGRNDLSENAARVLAALESELVQP